MSRPRTPTLEFTLVRMVIEAERLTPCVHRLTESLTQGSYADALDHLADLQFRIGHMTTIVMILRDSEDMQERLERKEKYGREATRAMHRSAHAGGTP